MFFTLTAAIGGAMAAAAWSIQDGPTVAVLAAGAAGLMSAVAASLVMRLERRARASGPEIEAELGVAPVADERPRQPRRRVAGSRPPLCRRRPGRPGAARFASVL